MKFAFCNEFCEGMPIEDVFALAARLGYDGVEIAPFTLAESVTEIGVERRREIVRAARAAGVEIVGLHWLLVSPKGLTINHPGDPALRRRTIDYLKELIHFCGDLGGRILVFGSPKQRNVIPGRSFAETWDLTVQAFLECVPVAAERDVVICIEPLASSETNFIDNHRDAMRLVDAVDSPNFRMILDVKAMSAESEPIPDIIRDARNHFVHFHANDANLRGPGFGDTDFVPIFAALQEIDYRGYASVEVFDFKPDGETIARESLRAMRESLPELPGPVFRGP